MDFLRKANSPKMIIYGSYMATITIFNVKVEVSGRFEKTMVNLLFSSVNNFIIGFEIHFDEKT